MLAPDWSLCLWGMCWRTVTPWRLNIRGRWGWLRRCACVCDCCVIAGYMCSDDRWDVCVCVCCSEQMGGEKSFSVVFITAGLDVLKQMKRLWVVCVVFFFVPPPPTSSWCNSCFSLSHHHLLLVRVCVCVRTPPARFLLVLAAHMINDLRNLPLPQTQLFSFMSFCLRLFLLQPNPQLCFVLHLLLYNHTRTHASRPQMVVCVRACVCCSSSSWISLDPGCLFVTPAAAVLSWGKLHMARGLCLIAPWTLVCVCARFTEGHMTREIRYTVSPELVDIGSFLFSEAERGQMADVDCR